MKVWGRVYSESEFETNTKTLQIYLNPLVISLIKWQFSCLILLVLIVISSIFWWPCLQQRPEVWSNSWELRLIITLCRCLVSDILTKLFVSFFYRYFIHFSFENLLLKKKTLQSICMYWQKPNSWDKVLAWKEMLAKSEMRLAGTIAPYILLLHSKQDNISYSNQQN